MRINILTAFALTRFLEYNIRDVMMNQRAKRKPATSPISGSKLPALAMCLLLLVLVPAWLPACAMSALIAGEGHLLSDFRQVGLASEYTQYNDPWDYLGFVMSTSRPNYYTEGYGLVSYADNNPLLTQDRMWFKRVRRPSDFGTTYYTGDYLRNIPFGDYIAPDTLDQAMFNLKNQVSRTAIVLCHARSASGLTYGNHPFWFNHHGKTYTLMHNGNANYARAFMINKITAMNSELDWFHVHPSNHFANPNPWQWVDSEVMFHFIMSHIMANRDNTEAGIVAAMQELRSYLDTLGRGVYNYVLSDGEKLYAFRSTPTTGAYSQYKLSYKDGHGYYAIRTQPPSQGFVQLEAKELVILSRNEAPRHLRIDEIEAPDTQNNESTEEEISISLSPNPTTQNGILRVSIIGDLPKSTNFTYELYNTRGQLLQKTDKDQIADHNARTIQLGKLASGVYFLRVRTDTLSQTKRFTVVK
jgi:hypothetical protein